MSRILIRAALTGLAAVAALTSASTAARASTPAPNPPTPRPITVVVPPDPTLLYHQECNGAGTVDTGVQWAPEFKATIDPPRWRDGSAASYVNTRTTSYVDGQGHCVISARRDPVTGAWTSAMLNLHPAFGDITPGMAVTVRAKVAATAHFVSGLWMVGACAWDSVKVGGPQQTGCWPQQGEIDTNESKNPNTSHQTIHYPSLTATWSNGEPKDNASGSQDTPIDASVYHTWTTVIQPEFVDVYIDGVKVIVVPGRTHTFGKAWVNPLQWPAVIAPKRWVASMTVGGGWAGDPVVGTGTPSRVDMAMDYLRINSIPITAP